MTNLNLKNISIFCDTRKKRVAVVDFYKKLGFPIENYLIDWMNDSYFGYNYLHFRNNELHSNLKSFHNKVLNFDEFTQFLKKNKFKIIKPKISKWEISMKRTINIKDYNIEYSTSEECKNLCKIFSSKGIRLAPYLQNNIFDQPGKYFYYHSGNLEYARTTLRTTFYPELFCNKELKLISYKDFIKLLNIKFKTPKWKKIWKD